LSSTRKQGENVSGLISRSHRTFCQVRSLLGCGTVQLIHLTGSTRKQGKRLAARF
jgi:hypothetical protein